MVELAKLALVMPAVPLRLLLVIPLSVPVIATVPVEVITPPLRLSPLTGVVLAVMLVTVPTVLDLLLNVVQSVELNKPLLVALAVGTFNVITGVVELLATVLVISVPVAVKVNAATLVTVPVLLVLLLKIVQSVELR